MILKHALHSLHKHYYCGHFESINFFFFFQFAKAQQEIAKANAPTMGQRPMTSNQVPSSATPAQVSKMKLYGASFSFMLLLTSIR